MKRYFLLACLSGLLAAPMGQAQPTVDLGPNFIVSERNPALSQAAARKVASNPDVATAPDVAEGSSPGLLSRVSHWIGPRCEPAPACESNAICVGPGACATGGCQSTGERWDRFKTWLTYRSDHGKLLPCFEPNKYRPPLYNWFPCYEGCAPGCGPHGCGGPPITYFYPSKQHPAPPSPKLELRGPQGQPAVNLTAAAPAAKTPASLIPGMRFASAETPGVPEKKRSSANTPAAMGVIVAGTTAAPVPLAARPEQANVSWQTSLKKVANQP